MTLLQGTNKIYQQLAGNSEQSHLDLETRTAIFCSFENMALNPYWLELAQVEIFLALEVDVLYTWLQCCFNILCSLNKINLVFLVLLPGWLAISIF